MGSKHSYVNVGSHEISLLTAYVAGQFVEHCMRAGIITEGEKCLSGNRRRQEISACKLHSSEKVNSGQKGQAQ